MKKWIVELWDGCWLSTWSGDPGRTLVKDSAKQYKTEFGANCALGRAKRLFPNRDYSNSRILEVEESK